MEQYTVVIKEEDAKDMSEYLDLLSQADQELVGETDEVEEICKECFEALDENVSYVQGHSSEFSIEQAIDEIKVVGPSSEFSYQEIGKEEEEVLPSSKYLELLRELSTRAIHIAPMVALLLIGIVIPAFIWSRGLSGF